MGGKYKEPMHLRLNPKRMRRGIEHGYLYDEFANHRSPPLSPTPAAVTNQSPTHTSCMVTLTPSQAGRFSKNSSRPQILSIYDPQRLLTRQGNFIWMKPPLFFEHHTIINIYYSGWESLFSSDRSWSSLVTNGVVSSLSSQSWALDGLTGTQRSLRRTD